MIMFHSVIKTFVMFLKIYFKWAVNEGKGIVNIKKMSLHDMQEYIYIYIYIYSVK